MELNDKLKYASFFLTISEWDRHMEVIRQVLNSIPAFEPYAAFCRLTRGMKTLISSENIERFLQENGQGYSDSRSIELLIRIFDTRFKSSLDFHDFLKLILSKDNTDERFKSAIRSNYENNGESLQREIEFTLCKFFNSACQFLERMLSDPDLGYIMSNTDRIFREIDYRCTGQLDFGNLKEFFEKARIKPHSTEIIAILRSIDVNNDGIIYINEFDFFIRLFSGETPSQLVAHELSTYRDRNRRSIVDRHQSTHYTEHQFSNKFQEGTFKKHGPNFGMKLNGSNNQSNVNEDLSCVNLTKQLTMKESCYSKGSKIMSKRTNLTFSEQPIVVSPSGQTETHFKNQMETQVHKETHLKSPSGSYKKLKHNRSFIIPNSEGVQLTNNPSIQDTGVREHLSNYHFVDGRNENLESSQKTLKRNPTTKQTIPRLPLDSILRKDEQKHSFQNKTKHVQSGYLLTNPELSDINLGNPLSEHVKAYELQPPETIEERYNPLKKDQSLSSHSQNLQNLSNEQMESQTTYQIGANYSNFIEKDTEPSLNLSTIPECTPSKQQPRVLQDISHMAHQLQASQAWVKKRKRKIMAYSNKKMKQAQAETLESDCSSQANRQKIQKIIQNDRDLQDLRLTYQKSMEKIYRNTPYYESYKDLHDIPTREEYFKENEDPGNGWKKHEDQLEKYGALKEYQQQNFMLKENQNMFNYSNGSRAKRRKKRSKHDSSRKRLSGHHHHSRSRNRKSSHSKNKSHSHTKRLKMNSTHSFEPEDLTATKRKADPKYLTGDTQEKKYDSTSKVLYREHLDVRVKF